MSWSVWSCNTVSGDKLQKLPVPASFPWARALNAGAGGSAVFPLRDTVFSRLDMRDLTVPLARTLVLEWDGVPVYAGQIDRRTYNHALGVLTVQHSDLWTILNRRMAVDHTAAESKLVNQVFTSLSAGTVAKKLVQLALSGSPSRNMSLPITFAADAAGPISRTYYGYHFPFLGDLLRDLIAEEGGADIDFQPRWVGGKLNYLMRTGSVASPQLLEGLYEWNMHVERSGILGLSVVEDSAKLATNAVVLGEGSEVDMHARSVPELGSIYPYMERVSMRKTIDSDSALSRLAGGDLATFKQPTEQWGFSVLASGEPKVSDLLLGGRARTWAQDDPWLAHGWHDNRIIGFSGDLSETVKLQFQPEVI